MYYKSAVESITTGSACEKGSNYWVWPSPCGGFLQVRLAARKPVLITKRTFHVMKLRDPDRKQAFQNRFESLFLQKEEVRNVKRDGGEQV